MPAVKFRTLLVLLPLAAAACAPAAAEDAPPAKPAPKRPWLDPWGNSIVGFGLLRVVPPQGGAKFEIHYAENPTEYSADDQYQLFVLPGDAFATKDHAYAGEFLAYTRTRSDDVDGTADLDVSFSVDQETTVIVAYGPLTAPDAGRPSGDVPTFRLDVKSAAGAHEWIESEMGELITTCWNHRPEVKRGNPFREPPELSDGDVFLEVRPMILYDGRMVRGADEPPAPERRERGGAESPPDVPDARERSIDAAAVRPRSDRQIVMTRALTERFRRVPIRWR
jgi:hypothetical protein